jgi:glycosidase
MESIKKEFLVIGESWHHDSDWLFSEGGIHGLTNYSFYWRVVVPLLEKASLPLDKIAQAIIDLNYRYSYRNGRYCWNFLSNHDLPRLYSIIADKANYKNAIVLLYALPGIPVVYYGEETGLQGLGDPDNRRCMEWPPQGGDTLFGDIYRVLNRLRKDHKSLFSQGNIAIPYVDNGKGLLILERFTSQESMYFIFNFSPEPHRLHRVDAINKISLLAPLTHAKSDPGFDLEGNSFKILYSNKG